MSGNILETILAEKRREIVAAAAAVPLSQLKAESERTAGCRGFSRALRRAKAPAIIAEIKRASPSKGPIRPDLDPVEAAKSFAAAGAVCLSVLTDKKFFQGELDFLRRIRTAVLLPLLRKDFICHPYQVWESRVAGADAILLIVAALDDAELELLTKEARAAGLDVLIEVHTEDELGRALRLLESSFATDESILLGINNRDLKTFDVDLKVTERLIGILEKQSSFRPRTPLVAESGISRGEHIKELSSYGAGAFLIGESIVATGDLRQNLEQLISEARA